MAQLPQRSRQPSVSAGICYLHKIPTTVIAHALRRVCMKIGELAGSAGVNVQTVRYYERRGLLDDPRATAQSYREYDSTTVNRLRFIRRAQELGFTLVEIGQLLELRLDPGTTAGTVKARASEKIAEIETKIRDLMRIRDALSHLAGTCHGDLRPSGACPLLDALGPID